MGTRAYLVGQGYQNMRKHSSKTFSTMFIICATMIILGLFIIAFVNIQVNVKTVAVQQGMQAFISDTVSEEEIEAMSDKIQGVANVSEIRYLNKEAALEDAKATLNSYDYLLKGLEDANPFPRSFIIIFKDLKDSDKVKNTVATIDGIYNVKYNEDIINAVIAISNIAKFVIFGIGTFMIIISTFIISNTIKLAVYSNKREIYIMKYIGATPGFIKTPFIIEGVLMGIGSAMLSWVIISLGYIAAYARLPKVGSTLGVFGFVAYSEFWYIILGTFFLLGILLGGLGSILATSKYLKDFKPDSKQKKMKESKEKEIKIKEKKTEVSKEEKTKIEIKKDTQKDKDLGRKHRRGLKMFFVFAILFSLFGASKIYATSTIDDIKQDLESLKNKQAYVLKKYELIQSDIEIYNKELDKLDLEVKKYQTDVNELNNQVTIISKEVKDIENELQGASVGYLATQDLLNARLRVLYENGFANVWQMLFTSSSITDFIAKYNVIIDLVNYDQKMLTSMQTQKEYINNIKKDAALRKTQIVQVQYDVQKSQQALELAKANKEAKVKILEASKLELAKLKKIISAQLIAANKKLDAEIAKLKNYNASFSGDFAWPAPDVYLVTAMFHDKYYRKHYGIHYGADIARSAGSDIVAAQDGKVVILTDWGNYGYGKHIAINHGTDSKTGKNIITVYGHLSSFAVSKNQKVKKGQKIGKMGTSGYSTGVHLHFEIKANKIPTDPILQFKGMRLKYQVKPGLVIDYPWSNLSRYQF